MRFFLLSALLGLAFTSPVHKPLHSFRPGFIEDSPDFSTDVDDRLGGPMQDVEDLERTINQYTGKHSAYVQPKAVKTIHQHCICDEGFTVDISGACTDSAIYWAPLYQERVSDVVFEVLDGQHVSGPKPEDCKVTFQGPILRTAGVYWHMIEGSRTALQRIDVTSCCNQVNHPELPTTPVSTSQVCFKNSPWFQLSFPMPKGARAAAMYHIPKGVKPHRVFTLDYTGFSPAASLQWYNQYSGSLFPKAAVRQPLGTWAFVTDVENSTRAYNVIHCD
ncbi:MAG: ORF7 protein [Tadarida brasiliensis bat alphacoronavirus 1]|nr:MAG: ORF7 protein [Tadarida brasiliensis bat alphacoronavirus 1]